MNENGAIVEPMYSCHCSLSTTNPTWYFVGNKLCFRLLQGVSNMTGTNCDLFTHKSVPVIFVPPCIFRRVVAAALTRNYISAKASMLKLRTDHIERIQKSVHRATHILSIGTTWGWVVAIIWPIWPEEILSTVLDVFPRRVWTLGEERNRLLCKEMNTEYSVVFLINHLQCDLAIEATDT